MASDHIGAHLDDYLDERLDAGTRSSIETHLESCQACRAELEAAQKLRSTLAALPVYGPANGFFEKAMQEARKGNHGSERKSRHVPWIPAALAAGLAVMLVGGLLLRQPVPLESQSAPAGAVANITMALEEARTVNLVFDAVSPLDDVILTVDLPPGLELAGYPGRMQLRWATNLEAGKNRLPLELVAIDGMGGEIVATMQSASTEKVFRIEVEVVNG